LDAIGNHSLPAIVAVGSDGFRLERVIASTNRDDRDLTAATDADEGGG